MSTKHTISDIFSGNNGGRRGAVRAWLLIGVCALLGAFLVGCPESETTNTDPSVSVTETSPDPLTENSLNGAAFSLTLKNATYTDPLPEDVITLTTTPPIAGLSVGLVLRLSDTETVVMLLKDSVDFTVDTELTVTVLAAGHSGNGNLTAPAVPITAVATPALEVSLSTPVANAITEGNTAGTTLTVDLDAPAPTAGLSVLVDITQMTPATTPANVTYGLDYGVAIDTDSTSTGFTFDSATTPGTLMTRRVEVPFAATDTRRTLTITAAEDMDGLSEVLSIRLVADNSYRITSENTNDAAATRTLTMTDNEPVVTLELLTVDTGLGTNIVDEDARSVTIELTLPSAAPAGGVTVNLAVSGTADRGDVSARSGSFDILDVTQILIEGSMTEVQSTYSTQDDGDTDDGDETVIVTVLPGDGYRVPQSNNSASIIIRDTP